MRLYANQRPQRIRQATQADAKRESRYSSIHVGQSPLTKQDSWRSLTLPKPSRTSEAVEAVPSRNAKPESVENAIIRVRADNFDRENTPTVNKGIRTKRVVCYLEYDAAADEVTNVQMVSQMQLAQDDYSSWDKLDQQLSENHDDA